MEEAPLEVVRRGDRRGRSRHQEGRPRVLQGRALSPRFFETPDDFRAWLEKHHAKKTELLVGFYKRATNKPSITWPQSVDEALCFGWIDGVRKSIDATAYTIRFTPRKKSSIWSAVNVARVAALEKAGKMRPAGRAAFAARRDDRTAVYSFERKKDAKLEPAHARKFATHAKAKTWFEAQAPYYRRAALHWVTSAKREDTREKRLAQLIEDCAAGRRIKAMIVRKSR